MTRCQARILRDDRREAPSDLGPDDFVTGNPYRDAQLAGTPGVAGGAR